MSYGADTYGSGEYGLEPSIPTTDGPPSETNKKDEI